MHAASINLHRRTQGKPLDVRWPCPNLTDLCAEALIVLQGTAKRWEVVTAYVRTRTTEEVLDMVKHGLKNKRAQNKADQFSIAKKRQGNTAINSDPTGRNESFTDVDVNLSGQCRS